MLVFLRNGANKPLSNYIISFSPTAGKCHFACSSARHTANCDSVLLSDKLCRCPPICSAHFRISLCLSEGLSQTPPYSLGISLHTVRNECMKWDKLFFTKIADINYEVGISSATYVTQFALMQLKCQKITI